MFPAGTLKDRVIIERRATGADAIGQPVETWQTVATVWGNLRYPTGVAAIKAGADISTVQASIRIRHRTDLDAGLRARAAGRVFNIAAVLPNRPEGYLDLVCEVVA